MEKRNLENDIFEIVVKHSPLVSIDLILEDNSKKFLLGKRKNNPAKGTFFVPGGRILKGETISQAFKRITSSELGKEFNLKDAIFINVYEHFYNNSFFGNNISTHYIVLAYKILNIYPEDLKLPLEQHSEYLWISTEEIINRDDVHIYTKRYFQL